MSWMESTWVLLAVFALVVSVCLMTQRQRRFEERLAPSPPVSLPLGPDPEISKKLVLWWISGNDLKRSVTGRFQVYWVRAASIWKTIKKRHRPTWPPGPQIIVYHQQSWDIEREKKLLTTLKASFPNTYLVIYGMRAGNPAERERLEELRGACHDLIPRHLQSGFSLAEIVEQAWLWRANRAVKELPTATDQSQTRPKGGDEGWKG